MQNRMKKHPLNKEQIHILVIQAETVYLAMIGDDGFPYVVPVSFVNKNHAILFTVYLMGLAGYYQAKPISRIRSI